MMAITTEAPVKSCPLYGSGHHWRCQPYERYIARETCSCGAVRFSATDINPGKDVWKQIEELNRKHGKEGTMPKLPEDKTNNMTEELHTEGAPAASTGETAENISRSDDLPPVPPRPKDRKLASIYWQEHKDEVLADLAKLGHKATVERWNISPSVLTKLRGNKGKGRNHKKADNPGITAIDKSNGEEVKVTRCPECKHIVTADGLGHKQGCPQRPKPVSKTKRPTTAFEPASSLPPLPHFDSNWPELVQLRWLDTYKALAGGNR